MIAVVIMKANSKQQTANSQFANRPLSGTRKYALTDQDTNASGSAVCCFIRRLLAVLCLDLSDFPPSKTQNHTRNLPD